MMLPGFHFEKVDASLAQRNCHLDSFVAKNEVLWPGQEIRNNLEVS